MTDAVFSGDYVDLKFIKSRKVARVTAEATPEFFAEWSMPVTECGCWLWLRAAGTRNYGQLKFKGKTEKAHRISWIAHKGAIPSGMHVLHKCDVPLCVNPDHLFIGTMKDNMKDKEAKGRGNHATGDRSGARKHPEKWARGDDHYTRRIKGIRQGEKNGRAKLSELDAMVIYHSKRRMRDLVRDYGVTRTTIRNIKIGKLWSHLCQTMQPFKATT